MTVHTQTKNESRGSVITYSHEGRIRDSYRRIRATSGTTVTVTNLFKRLPVRHQEFKKNCKREFAKLNMLLQAYGVVSEKKRISLLHDKGNGKWQRLWDTRDSLMHDNILIIFGTKITQKLVPLEVANIAFKTPKRDKQFSIRGYFSKPMKATGRSNTDRQFLFVNGRPVDYMRLARAFNETYKEANPSQYPIFFINFTMDPDYYDVNVTPDKRTIMLHDELLFIEALQIALVDYFCLADQHVFATHGLTQVSSPAGKQYSFSSPARSGRPKTSSREEIGTNMSLSTFEDEVAVPSRDSSKSKTSSKAVSATTSQPSSAIVQRRRAVADEEEYEDDDESTFLTDTTQAAAKASQERVVGKLATRTLLAAQQDTTPCTTTSTTRVTEASTYAAAASVVPPRTTPTSVTKSSALSRVLAGYSSQQATRSPSPLRTSQPNKPPISTSATATTPLKKKAVIDSVVQQFAFRGTDPISAQMSEAILKRSLSLGALAISKKRAQGKIPPADDDEPEEAEEPKRPPQSTQGKRKRIAQIVAERVALRIGAENAKKKRRLNPETPEDEEPEEASDHEDEPSVICITDDNEFLKEELKAFQFATPKGSDIVIPGNIAATIARNRAKLRTPVVCAPTPTGPKFKNSFDKIQGFEDDADAMDELMRTFPKRDFQNLRVVGQFNKGFIIAMLGAEHLFIIDQHAADEKYNFERLRETTILHTQPLLKPKIVEMPASDAIVVEQNQEIFNKNGFFFTFNHAAPPTQRVQLISVPFSKNKVFGVNEVYELIMLLDDLPGVMVRPSSVIAMFASRACHQAVRVGDDLDRPQMQKILSQMATLKNPWSCPHGRPTMRHLIDLTTYEPLVQHEAALDQAARQACMQRLAAAVRAQNSHSCTATDHHCDDQDLAFAGGSPVL
eukprot:TRINITY_DN6728_c2_g1_i3.p1 TRINITY_DN6728_c2_g1~~TRINITY_DN6728_c2_g1_i3.p1  ORF type:complete len:904 (-),score=142.25 TRINITY_DN6728_c2_g1_i3:51-2762(-)